MNHSLLYALHRTGAADVDVGSVEYEHVVTTCDWCSAVMTRGVRLLLHSDVWQNVYLCFRCVETPVHEDATAESLIALLRVIGECAA